MPDQLLITKIASLLLIVFLLNGCSSESHPPFSGKAIRELHGSGGVLELNLNGHVKEVILPRADGLHFGDPVWMRKQDKFLMYRGEKSNACYNYSIVAFNINGEIVDTVFSSPPCHSAEFMLSPNDRLLLIRSYDDDLRTSKLKGKVTYFVYDIQDHVMIDSIEIENCNLDLSPIRETNWSPDSKRAIVYTCNSSLHTAAIYDLKGGIESLDEGHNFLWSPTDENLVSYVKKDAIVFKNLETNEVREFYQSEKPTSIRDYRWDPAGKFLIIDLNGYYLNIKGSYTWRLIRILISVDTKVEFRNPEGYDMYDTWKGN